MFVIRFLIPKKEPKFPIVNFITEKNTYTSERGNLFGQRVEKCG